MFELNAEVAEFVGALLGDGCLSKYWSNSENCWRFEIAFTGSLEDFNYYRDFLQPVCQNNFGFSGRLFKRANSTRFHIRSTVLFDYFKRFGLPVGFKGGKMIIPGLICQNKKLMVSCVRGLFNADGSIYRRIIKTSVKKYSYVLIGLKLEAVPVLQQVKRFLESLGIRCSNLSKSNNCFVLTINNSKGVNSFLEMVGFSNQKHLKRIKFLMNISDK